MFLWLLLRKKPWTLHSHGPDHTQICPTNNCEYPKPDEVLTFDLLTSVALTGTNHEQCRQIKTTSGDWDITGNTPTYWIHVNVHVDKLFDWSENLIARNYSKLHQN